MQADGVILCAGEDFPGLRRGLSVVLAFCFRTIYFRLKEDWGPGRKNSDSMEVGSRLKASSMLPVPSVRFMDMGEL